ncbi:MAG: glycosyltransferase [Xanthobacteraceae bacterium]|nr:glycosyltransferase [Xanthobacteraceae bacterium]
MTDPIRAYIDNETEREAQFTNRHLAAASEAANPLAASPRSGPADPSLAWLVIRAIARATGLAQLRRRFMQRPPPPAFDRERRFFARFDSDDYARCFQTPSGQRIYLDVTQTILCDFEAGIPRVVRRISTNALKLGGIPSFVHAGELWTFEPATLQPILVSVEPGDVFAIIDQGWTIVAQLQTVMAMVRSRGGRNVLLVYDMLPLLHPELFVSGFEEIFATWLAGLICTCDAVVTISESVAREFAQYVIGEGIPFNPVMRLGWQHLGADFLGQHPGEPSAAIKSIAESDVPCFLSVGTIEPRKGYTVALDAMERLWNDGVRAHYVIVGRYGWNCRAIERRLLTHPQRGRYLHWLDSASDADLQYLYLHASALIVASVGEGFGLPIVEGARSGLPIIASDIPVFREIGGNAITFFDVADSAALAERIREVLAKPKTLINLPVLTWKQTAQGLLDLIRSDGYQFKFVDEAVPSPLSFGDHPRSELAPCTSALPAISIVTVIRDGYFFVRMLVERVREFVGSRQYEIIAVDRGSTDGIADWLALQPDVTLIKLEQRVTVGHGHGEAAEFGIRVARHNRIVLLDSDAFPIRGDWLELTADRLDARNRLAGARFSSRHAGNPHGWYVHPHFMAFFKADVGTLVKLRKLKGVDTDTGEEATMRVLASGYEVLAYPIEYDARFDVGRPNIPTISAGVFHAWYISRLEHEEDEVIRETDGAISRSTYSAPLQNKLRQFFNVTY